MSEQKTVTPEMIAAAWSAWTSRNAWVSRNGGELGPGPAFKEAIEAALAAAPEQQPVAVKVKCPCTTFEQDETCPVGYPSLVCSACQGTGFAEPEYVTALAAEMLKIAEEAGEVEDPFAAWETISLWRTACEKPGFASLAVENARLREALAAAPEPVAVTYTQAECDELCEIAERDGYKKAVQEIDQLTGGDGEYRVSMLIGGGIDDDRHTPDAPAMIKRIVDRFESSALPAPDLREENERLREALERIGQWCQAYPVAAFPEPDLAKAGRLLEAGGMTLDAISASNMRHALEGVGAIACAALTGGGND